MVGVAGCSGDDSNAADAQQSVPVIAPGKPGESNRTLSPEEAKSAVPEQLPNEADFAYAEMMIVHHQQAIAMTELAASYGEDKRVRGVADRISDAQGPEIDMMNRWLKEHGKPEVGTGGGHHGGGHGNSEHDMPGMASEEQLRELSGARGAEFDRLFLELMITHHDGAIVMAQEAQTKGADIRVQEMADDVISTQSAEIGRMQAILDA